MQSPFETMADDGWWVVPCTGNVWKVETLCDADDKILEGRFWTDPFTALFEAKKLVMRKRVAS